MSTVKLHEESKSTVTLADIKRAARRIGSYTHRTPVVTCESIDRIANTQLFFKCENLQKAGAFKFRGAVNALANLAPQDLAKGVVTHSSGNHAGALALAAKMFGTRAFLVMPENSIQVKRNAVLEYGGELISCLPNSEARETKAAEVQKQTGAIMIPPYDHYDIIAGQGTAAVELLHQMPNLDLLVAPVGGGGLLAGTAIASRGISPRVKVIGAEPAGADDAYRSKVANRRLPQENPQTIADGLRTGVGELTWPFIQRWVSEIQTVSEDEIVETMQLFWERSKIIIEPSSAVAVAVAMRLHQTLEVRNRNIGVILSGGNADLENLPWGKK
ncbi:MAG: pyridoxal-phosphate dependent enzyme [Pirellulaceae bacterium]